MGKRLAIPSKELALRLVGPADSFLASRIQRVDINTDVPTEDIDELGNPLHAGTTTDIPNVTLSFSAMDVGIKVFSVLTGTDPAAYPGAGVDISNLGEADAVLYVKDDAVAKYAKTAHARRMQVQDFTYSYSVDGNSTEDYTLIGSLKRWFLNDILVERFTAGTTSFTLTQTPVTLKNGDEALSVTLDGEYLEEVTVAPSAGEYRIVGTTLTTGDTRTSQVQVVYQFTLATESWSDVNDALLPASIRGKDADVIISANNIPRIQSVTINGNLNVQDVREMGNRNTVGYQRQVATIEGTLTVLDTDTELIDLLTSGSIGSGDTEFQPGVDVPAPGSEIGLRIQLVDPSDSSEPFTVLKTIDIPEITIAGDSYTQNVNENAQQVFNFRSSDAQCVVYSGSV